METGTILDDPKERVKMLKAGFTGKEIEWIATRVLATNLRIRNACYELEELEKILEKLAER